MTTANPPTTIGPYTVVRELGRGGMGVVYLAKDGKLDRHVAIKALPAHLAQDPDRLSRFQREAKVLASLNHPGIAAIYGLEEVGGTQYLVLEYVDGESLADRLARGALPLDEALPLAKQIAEALEAAHEKGIVHRDLKPANVMLTSDGAIKVLDFGLARADTIGSPSTGGGGAGGMGGGDSPTLTSPVIHSPTIPGAIMGTAGYMSPEQARGKAVDKRSDIFSFGCVLFEMLSGKMPFGGETVADSLGATLHKEHDVRLLPATVPPRIRELLANCLAKDRKQRLHDIGDARLTIERALTTGETDAGSAPARRRSPAGVLAGALALLGAGWGLAAALMRPTPVGPRQAFHVSTMVPDKPPFNGLVGISPDAKFLVYTAWPELPTDSAKPTGLLMVRRLDRDECTAIDGTEGAREAALSPDGRWLAFSCAKDRSSTKFLLKKIALDGGRPSGKPEIVCDLPLSTAPSLCWASDRDIVFSPPWEPTFYAVSASGGEPRVVLREDIAKGIESWQELRPLVAGQSILATRWSLVGQKVKVNVEAIDLASGKRTLVLPDAGSAVFVPDREGGMLLATRTSQNSLIAVRFDPRTLRTVGEPVTVWSGNPINAFRVAPDGTLAIATRSPDVSDRRLAWIDEKGQPQPIAGPTRAYGQIAISPDGRLVLVQLDTQNQAELNSELFLQDLARPTFTRIPVQGLLFGTVWSADGQRTAHGMVSEGAFSICERRLDGTGEPTSIYSGPDSRTFLATTAWAPDGKTIALVQVDMSTDNADAYLLTQDTSPGKWVAKPYLKTPASEAIAAFSPDGKWALVSSSRSGRDELYVQPFTGDGEADTRAGRRQLSTTGASTQALWWSPDGKEIRYLDTDRQVVSLHVKTEPTFSAAEPKVLYSIKDLKTNSITFAPDGRLMVVLQGENERTTKSVGIVVNFLDELRATITTAK